MPRPSLPFIVRSPRLEARHPSPSAPPLRDLRGGGGLWTEGDVTHGSIHPPAPPLGPSVRGCLPLHLSSASAHSRAHRPLRGRERCGRAYSASTCLICALPLVPLPPPPPTSGAPRPNVSDEVYALAAGRKTEGGATREYILLPVCLFLDAPGVMLTCTSVSPPRARGDLLATRPSTSPPSGTLRVGVAGWFG